MSLIKRKWLSVIIVGIIFLIILTGVLYYSFIQHENILGITSLEGKKIADEESQNWDKNAILVGVRSTKIDNNGYASEWRYSYIRPFDANISANMLDIIVTSSKSYKLEEYFEYSKYYAIINWTRDSPEIVKISKSNPSIREFISDYPNSKIERIDLVGQNKSGLSNLWTIEWTYIGIPDIPHNAIIWIDDNSGTVIDTWVG